MLYVQPVTSQGIPDVRATLLAEAGTDVVLGAPSAAPLSREHLIVTRGAPTMFVGRDLSNETPIATALRRAGADRAILDRRGTPSLAPAEGATRQLFVAAPDRAPTGELIGWGVVTFAPDHLVAQAQRNAGTRGRVDVTWHASDGVVVNVASVTPVPAEPAGTAVRKTFVLPTLSGSFAVRLTPPAGAGTDNAGPLVLAIGGSLASALLACLLVVVARGRARALQLVDEATADLEVARRRLEVLVQDSSDVITIIDVDGTIGFVSSSVERVLGYAPDTVLGRPATELFAGPDLGRVQEVISRLRPGQSREIELEVRHRDGLPVLAEATMTNRVDDPAVRGVVLNLHDVTSRRMYEQLLAHQASHDPLTGVGNRARLFEVLEQARHGADAVAPTSLAMLFIDLDRFKEVNDRYGHLVGDEMLRILAARLSSHVRADDTVVRVGGDEFLVVCPGMTELEADVLTQRLDAAIREPYMVAGRQVRVTASIGVAVGDLLGDDLDGLLAQADAAMYATKTQRRSDVG